MKREFYIDRITPFVDKKIIKVLTGIRRCGKSFIMGMLKDELLARKIAPEQIIEANFESRKLDFVQSVDLAYGAIRDRVATLENRRVYLLFDEIQELEGWERLVNSVFVDFDADIYLTGSNAKLLSSELSTYLAGRYVEFHVYPLSFAESLRWYRAEDSQISVREAFRRFVRDGGMPFVHEARLDGDVRRAYLTDVFNSVVLKDIAKRHKVRDIDLLERILFYLVREAGHPFSAQSLVRFLKSERRTVAFETLYNYLNYAQEACLALPFKRMDLVGKQTLVGQEKVYVVDHGFRESLFGDNEACIDQVLENIVAVELVRRGYDVTVGKVGAKEVDFVAARGAERLYVQVAYLMPTPETRAREFAALEAIDDNYPKFVLSLDEFDFSAGGIRHQPIPDFLLAEDTRRHD